MITLKKAKEEDLIESFINEHQTDQEGDQDLFEKVLDSISHPEKLKSTQETSVQDSSEN